MRPVNVGALKQPDADEAYTSTGVG